MRQSAIDTNLAPELNARNEASSTYPFEIAYVGEYWRVQDNRTAGLSSTRHQLYKNADAEAVELKAKQVADNAARVLTLAETKQAQPEIPSPATEAPEPVAEKPTRAKGRRRTANALASAELK